MRRLLPFMFAAGMCFANTYVARAQNDAIRPNPAAVTFQHIWWISREAHDQAEVGGIGDVNGDGLMDFGVRLADSTKLYLGAREWHVVNPFQTRHVSEIRFDAEMRPTLGDFWGTGKDAIAFVSNAG